jgi:hypothetical protein
LGPGWGWGWGAISGNGSDAFPESDGVRSQNSIGELDRGTRSNFSIGGTHQLLSIGDTHRLLASLSSRSRSRSRTPTDLVNHFTSARSLHTECSARGAPPPDGRMDPSPVVDHEFPHEFVEEVFWQLPWPTRAAGEEGGKP